MPHYEAVHIQSACANLLNLKTLYQLIVLQCYRYIIIIQFIRLTLTSAFNFVPVQNTNCVKRFLCFGCWNSQLVFDKRRGENEETR